MASGNTLAKAYIQLLPTTKGFTNELAKDLDPQLDEAGKKGGNKFASAFKKIIAAAGIGKVLKDALSEGAALEQSLGGVETMFKEHADIVKRNAENAYKTAGMSANEYMENVTSFSASLLQSMGNDTEKAASKADMAMVDMSDNANKFGTDMQSIQNAYQGFAKQNYTMLDNLKLGYGGTKTEMERLLADATKLSGVEYNIDNLADVYDAIHIVQQEMGVTGTTALEAAETFSGSLGMMKSSYKNLIGQIAIGGDIKAPLKAMSDSIVTFSKNLMPMVTNVLTALPEVIVSIIGDAGPQLIESGAQAIASLLEGLAKSLPELIPAAVEAVSTLVVSLIESLPMIVSAGAQLLEGIVRGLLNAIPVLIEEVPKIIQSIVSTLSSLLPLIVDAGIKIFVALIENLPGAIVQIVEELPLIIDSIITTLLDNLPLIIDAGVKLLVALIEAMPLIVKTIVDSLPLIISGIITGILGSIPQIVAAGVQLFIALVQNLPQIIWEIVKAVPQIIAGIVDGFLQGVGQMAEVGLNLIQGLWNGISDAGAWLWDKISGFFGGIVDNIKGFFGIHSPSRLFAEIGMYLDEGLAEGLEDNIKPINKAMDEVQAAATRDFESQARIGISAQSQINAINREIDHNVSYGKESNSVSLDKQSIDNLAFVMLETIGEIMPDVHIDLDGENYLRGKIRFISQELGALQLKKARG